MAVNRKGYRYDYSLKNKSDRANFIEDKLGYLLNMKPYQLMGYSSSSRDDEKKFNKIPNMLDKYTEYLLSSGDIKSTRKTEYSFYISDRDEYRRKGNQETIHKSKSFEASDGSSDGLTLTETHDSEEGSILDGMCTETIESQVIKYAITNNKFSVKDYKKLLSMSGDILIESKDSELKDMVEQVVFNCIMTSETECDKEIIRHYVKGISLRDISKLMDMGKTTVDRRIVKMLAWVGQNYTPNAVYK